MSLYALSESVRQPTREEIECALAGNLCRCTGYRPIVEAATRIDSYRSAAREVRASTAPAADADDETAMRKARIQRLDAIGTEDCMTLSRPERRYWAPTRLTEFAELRLRYPEAVILAGGTDLGLAITKKHVDLPTLLYIGGVSELKQITRTDAFLEIGVAATLTDAFDSLVAQYPELAEWARRFASPPIRNVGTLGGNIGNGSPIGDSMPVLMALGASLVLRRGEQTRELPLDEFYLGYQRNVLAAGEFIERVLVPVKKPGGHLLRVYKISKRFDQDISAVCGAFALRTTDGLVTDVRIAFGGMAAVPKRATHCESVLTGRAWKETAVREAMDALSEDFEPIDDMRASKGYRQLVAQNLLYKCFLETTGVGRVSVTASEV
jgi:xanthine dehydrogenase small subunit